MNDTIYDQRLVDEDQIRIKPDSILSKLAENWQKSNLELKQEILKDSYLYSLSDHDYDGCDFDSLADYAYENRENSLFDFKKGEVLDILCFWDGKILKEENKK